MCNEMDLKAYVDQLTPIAAKWKEHLHLDCSITIWHNCLRKKQWELWCRRKCGSSRGGAINRAIYVMANNGVVQRALAGRRPRRKRSCVERGPVSSAADLITAHGLRDAGFEIRPTFTQNIVVRRKGLMRDFLLHWLVYRWNGPSSLHCLANH